MSDTPSVVVRPDFKVGLPLNITLFTVGGFWLLLGAIAAFNVHVLWTVISCLIAFAFFAAPLLYYRNASLWFDQHWVGRTDLLGRRIAASRSDLGSVEVEKWLTLRYSFLRRDGKRAFDVYSYGWKPGDISSFVDSLGL